MTDTTQSKTGKLYGAAHQHSFVQSVSPLLVLCLVVVSTLSLVGWDAERKDLVAQIDSAERTTPALGNAWTMGAFTFSDWDAYEVYGIFGGVTVDAPKGWVLKRLDTASEYYYLYSPASVGKNVVIYEKNGLCNQECANPSLQIGFMSDAQDLISSLDPKIANVEDYATYLKSSESGDYLGKRTIDGVEATEVAWGSEYQLLIPLRGGVLIVASSDAKTYAGLSQDIKDTITSITLPDR